MGLSFLSIAAFFLATSTQAQDPSAVLIVCNNIDQYFSFECKMTGEIKITAAKGDRKINSGNITPAIESACGFEFQTPEIIGARLRSKQYLLNIHTQVSEDYSQENASVHQHNPFAEEPIQVLEVLSEFAEINGTPPESMNLRFDLERDCKIKTNN
jgi:hypothetical protein